MYVEIYLSWMFSWKVGRVDFDTQIQWFNNSIQQYNELLGPAEAKKLLAESIVITVLGSNDYVNNYLLSYSPDRKYTPTEFKEIVLQKSRDQVKVSSCLEDY